MYERFYGLTADPFRLLPDPDVCFPHQSCAKAWAYLRYAIKRGEGIVVVTGPPGTGKTTLGERLINELDPTKIVSVRLVAADLNATDLLRRLAYAFGMAAGDMDRAMLTYQIECYLAELERKDRSTVVLVIDEAQTLSGQALEALRVLTDLQSPHSRPLLQLFLLGQEGLEDVIGAPDMEQFRQRVIASCRLHTMDLPETKAYLEYRLQRVDWRGDPSIDGAAVYAIFRYSGGLPRHVNKICSRLLLYGCAEEKHRLEESDVLEVVRDLTDELLSPAQRVPEAQEAVARPPSTSLQDLELVATQDARADASPRHAAAQTLHLSEAFQETDSLSDAEVQQASPVQQYHDSSGMPHRRRIRSHGRHLLHSIRHRVSAIPDWLEGRWARLRVTAPVIAATMIGHVRRLGEKSAQAAAGAKPALLVWRRRLSTALASRPSQRQSILTVVSSAGLLAAGLLIWNIQDGERVDAIEPLATTSQPLPSSVSRVTQAIRADVFLELAGGRTSDQGLTPTSIPPTQRMAQDAATSSTIQHPSPDHEAPTPAQVAPAARRVTEPWVLSTAESGPTPQVTDDRAGPMLALAPQTTEVAHGETPPPTQSDPQTVLSSPPPPALGAVTATLSSATPSRASAVPALLAVAAPNEDDFTRLLPPTAAGDPSPDSTPDVAEPVATLDEAIQTAPVTAPDITIRPAESGVEDSERARIEQLLGLADAAIGQNRLLIPEDASAYHYLQQVLAIDPDNPQAHAGLERVVHRYTGKARKALNAHEYKTARRFVSRALRVDRRSAQARALRAKIEAAEAREKKEREEALAAARKAELERMAAEAKAAEPVAAKAPPRDSQSGFERIMKLLDGV